jgi:hypothetical protein
LKITASARHRDTGYRHTLVEKNIADASINDDRTIKFNLYSSKLDGLSGEYVLSFEVNEAEIDALAKKAASIELHMKTKELEQKLKTVEKHLNEIRGLPELVDNYEKRGILDDYKLKSDK